MGYNGSLRRSAEKRDVVRGYRRMAEQGDALAQYNLGNCYFDGDGVEQDDEEAVKWYRKSAEQGNAMAQYRLGDCYLNGDGVDKNEREAVEWYRRAAEQDNPDSQYKLGECCYNGVGVAKNFEEAVEWFLRAADFDNSKAQYKLGVCCYNGFGVAKSLEKAVEWFRKSAESGNAEAQYMLGNCYYNGEGVSRSFENAVEWFCKSVDSGNGDAEYMLGNCYYNGDGVSRNAEEALKWYRKSAESGNAKADFCLCNALSNYFGDCFYYGIGVDKNLGSALEWYRRAADQGDELAQLKLGDFYYKGDGVKKDFNEALKLWGKSAALGNAEAKEEMEMERNANSFRNAKVGDFVKFGRYPQESGSESQPVEWQVLSKENGQMLVISRYGLDLRRFDGSSKNWGNSEIRKWLNGEFYNGSFAAEEKALIKSFNQDNVFLLSREEAEKYFVDDDARRCKPTSYAKANGALTGKNGYCIWWLRSPSSDDSNGVYFVFCDGGVYDFYVSDDIHCARPALWINLESCNAEAKEEMEMERNANSFMNVKVGDFVKFGRYPQGSGSESQPVEWQVLARENNKALVISRYGLDARRFDDRSYNWEKSEIRKWLNGEFYNGSFAAEEKALIKSFNQDNVFLLSREEAEKYFVDDDARRCKPTSYAKANGALTGKNGYCIWWLRSPSSDDSNGVYFVFCDGGVYDFYVSDDIHCARPALWINLEF